MPLTRAIYAEISHRDLDTEDREGTRGEFIKRSVGDSGVFLLTSTNFQFKHVFPPSASLSILKFFLSLAGFRQSKCCG